MRRALLIHLVSIAVLTVALPAAAQRLDLDPAPQTPALPEHTAAGALAAELAREVDALRARSTADRRAALLLEAGIAWRRVAHELLTRGDDPTAPRNDLVIAGFRLADARGDFDRSLERLPAQNAAAEMASKALERFATTAPGTLRAAPTDQLLNASHAALVGLEPLLKALAAPQVENPWPLLSDSRIATPASESSLRSDQIRAVAKDAALPPLLAEALETVAARIAIAEEWPDLEPEVERVALPLLATAALAREFADAGWIPRALRESLLERLIAAVRASAEAESRARGLGELDHLAAIGRVLAATGALIRPRGQTASRGPIDPARVAKALAALAPPSPDPAALRGSLDRLAMIEVLLQTMIDVRRLEAVEVRRELRSLRKQLTRDALKAEDPVLRQVETLAAPDATTTDPACASLLESQRRRLRALAALDGVDHALTEIEARLPSRAAALGVWLRGALAQLTDSARSESALLRSERFLRQWNAWRELPGESDIRKSEPEAIALCAGRSSELLAEIDRRRDGWLAGWSVGTPDEGIAALSALADLLTLIDDAAALARTRANPRLIGRWGGWDDLGGLPGATDAMDARIAVAVEALARGDDTALIEATRLLSAESPVWRLRARLLRVLAPALEPLPDGLTGAIGRAVERPAPGAFMARRRDDLLTLARFSREFLYAQSRRDAETAERLHRFIRDLSIDLLRDVDAGSAASVR